MSNLTEELSSLPGDECLELTFASFKNQLLTIYRKYFASYISVIAIVHSPLIAIINFCLWAFLHIV